MSGGGKSTAIRALEDAGWFCIDNLPVLLVPKLLELVVHGASDEVHRLALVIDARDGRFLPNPYFVEGLKPHPGTDPRVSEWVLGRPQTQEFLERLESLLAFLLPQYKAEGKSYLTVSIGCTGGRHRSVALADELEKPPT